MGENIMVVDDYPEHLNPFDDNYIGTVEESAHTKQKYNTWSASRSNKLTPTPGTLVKQKSFLGKPWAALNISPKGKIVRPLSILKTAVERFASKKKRLSSSSARDVPNRSQSLHEDFNFRIISPKVKEKIRQQAFSRSQSAPDQDGKYQNEKCISPQLNSRLTPTERSENDSMKMEQNSPTCSKPLRKAEYSLKNIQAHVDAYSDVDNLTPSAIPLDKGSEQRPRPIPRKKKPPPPPPSRQADTDFLTEQDRTENSHSANSSITLDLEKDFSSSEENSLPDLEHTNMHLYDLKYI